MSELIRYGLKWNGSKDFVASQMEDGYWTPWHFAEAKVDHLARKLEQKQADLDRALARVAEFEKEMELFTAVAVLICQQESDEWDSDRLQTHKDYAEVCGQRIAKLTPVSANAPVLRKQAEAVEALASARFVYGTKERLAAMSYAQSLRNQADELEKGNGQNQ